MAGRSAEMRLEKPAVRGFRVVGPKRRA